MSHARVQEALDVLKQLGLPKRQQNTRSALTLLALLDMGPDDSWSAAKNPLCGITPMMNFFEKHYGRKYAPNSRETVRRYTVHQFLQASLIVENPDKPDRPTNSGKTAYQLTPESLRLLRRYGTSSWKPHLEEYVAAHSPHTGKTIYRRRDNAISIKLPSKTIRLSSGKHNALVGDICAEFTVRFVKKPVLIYVGDTAKKFAYFDGDMLRKLGVCLDPHGKIPDVMIYDNSRKWLFLVEAVTSHGPVDAKRRNELQKLFSKSRAEIVYVTAFVDMMALKRHAADISWKSEVWVADSPDHMIHFDGERFLGPYK